MRLADLGTALNLENLTPAVDRGETDVRQGYVSDLLSDVIANAPSGGVLVTVQVHLNVIAVAVHAELAAVIFAAGRLPDESVRTKAREEGVALYAASQSAFEIVGRLYQAGVRGPG